MIYYSLAQPDNLGTVMAILDEAACWLEQRGIKQWPCPHPPHFRRRVGMCIESAEVYIARTIDKAEPVGTIALGWSDPYWKERPGKAAYVHKMAVGNDFHGRGIGKHMLVWALDQARKAGAEALRLDCLAANYGLRAYYESHGFSWTAEITDRDYTAALYEMDIR